MHSIFWLCWKENCRPCVKNPWFLVINWTNRPLAHLPFFKTIFAIQTNEKSHSMYLDYIFNQEPLVYYNLPYGPVHRPAKHCNFCCNCCIIKAYFALFGYFCTNVLFHLSTSRSSPSPVLINVWYLITLLFYFFLLFFTIWEGKKFTLWDSCLNI